MAALAVRMVVSLAVVVGLLLLTTRLAGRRYRGSSQSTVQVLHRQPLSRGSTVTVVTVGGRVLVLGTTEQQVRVLAELDPEELAAAAGDEGTPARPVAAAAPVTPLRSVPTPLPAPATLPVPVHRTEPAAAAPYADFAMALLDELSGPAQAQPAPAPATASYPTPSPSGPGRHRAGPTPTRAAAPVPAPVSTPGAERGALAGSLLSPQTWRQALSALSGRAS